MIQKILLRPVLVEKKYITLAEYYIQTNNLREKWKKNLEYKNIKFEINSNPIFFRITTESFPVKELEKSCARSFCCEFEHIPKV